MISTTNIKSSDKEGAEYMIEAHGSAKIETMIVSARHISARILEIPILKTKASIRRCRNLEIEN